MRPPALPESFGNYALGEDFVEVVAPAAISWLPATAGWWWLGAAVSALLLRIAWKKMRRYYRNRYRREAQRRLRALAQAEPGEDWLVALNRLLKLTALAGFSRAEVAPLTGVEWVDFLNRRCATPVFTGQQRRLLAQGPYLQAVPGATEREQLLQASAEWIEHHRGRDDA